MTFYGTNNVENIKNNSKIFIIKTEIENISEME